MTRSLWDMLRVTARVSIGTATGVGLWERSFARCVSIAARSVITLSIMVVSSSFSSPTSEDSAPDELCVAFLRRDGNSPAFPSCAVCNQFLSWRRK